MSEPSNGSAGENVHKLRRPSRPCSESDGKIVRMVGGGTVREVRLIDDPWERGYAKGWLDAFCRALDEEAAEVSRSSR